MVKIEKLSDLLEIAIRIERAGLDFYQAAAKSTQNSAAKDAFSFLAAEEEKHIGVFRKILNEVADYSPRFEYPGEYELFLEGIARRSVFTSEGFKDKKVTATPDAEAALELAMNFETQSIIFYSEMLNAFKDSDKKYLQEVIKEEKNHFVKLVNLKDKIKF